MNKGKYLIWCRDFNLIWHRFKCPDGIQQEKLIWIWKQVTGFIETIKFDKFKELVSKVAIAYYSPRTEIKKLKAQKFWKPNKKFMKEKAALLQKYRSKTDYNINLNLEVSVMDP